MFGRAPSHLDNLAEHARVEGTTPAAYHESLTARLANYREMVDAQLSACEAETQERGPSEVTGTYHPGDPVWLWDSTPRHKLAPRWLGGWRVDALLGPVTARLVNDTGHRKVVHVDKIKPRILRCTAAPAPTWETFVDDLQAENNQSDLTSQQPPVIDTEGSADNPDQHTDGLEASTEMRLRRSERSRQLPARLADYQVG